MAGRLALVRYILLILLALGAGCELDHELALSPKDLAPVMTSQPQFRFALQPPSDVKVEPLAAYRGSRGGIILLVVRNTGEEPLLFDPAKVRMQLSSGQFRKAMIGEEFEEMSEQFGAICYGVGEALIEQASRWPFPAAGETYTLKPGQGKEIALAFGAQPEEAWVTLGIEVYAGPRLTESRKLLVAVMLPEVLPPRKHWLPEWLHFSFVFTNAG
jgi:hypothetical protein